MNKKAAIILLSASIAFFIASVIFLNTQIKMPYVLGDSQLAILGLEEDAEIYRTYLETAAKFSLAESIKVVPEGQKKDFYTLCSEKHKVCDELPIYVKKAFKKHLTSFNKVYDQNLNINNYEFKTTQRVLDNKAAIELVGVSTGKIVIRKGDNIQYSEKPNFKMAVNLEELNELATTSETIAKSFFRDVVEKFKNCPSKNEGKNCLCENSIINPDELPEGYHIKITTESERNELSKSAKYKFELLRGNEVISVDKRSTVYIVGRFGAHDFIKKDKDENLCYPGIISKQRIYFIEKESEKIQLFFYISEANCPGISEFSMVDIVKESELEGLTSTECKDIGVKD